MKSNTVDLEVRIGDHAVTQYQHEGKIFVEGREGSEFSLRVKNPHPYRVKVVLSIDQVNVISGDPATGDLHETGYILNAGETQTILGYRLDDDSVARFRFTKADASYAKSDKGMTGTTGVIGCRVYREKESPREVIVKEIHHHHNHTYWYEEPFWHRPYKPLWYDSSKLQGAHAFATCQSKDAAMGDTMRCAAPIATYSCASDLSQDVTPFALGSTFGAKTESKVTSVSFVAHSLVSEIVIYYTTKAGLESMGVDMSRKPKVAFPAAFSGKYAKPPAGWVG